MVLTSILFITIITSLLLFLINEAISLSKGEIPNFLSTTNNIKSAISIASYALDKIISSNASSFEVKKPPVSIKFTDFPSI